MLTISPTLQWNPCLQIIANAGLSIFAPVSDSDDIDVLQAFVGVNGVILTETTLETLQDTAKAKGLKVAMDVSNIAWGMDHVTKVDQLVIFNGNEADFEVSCANKLCHSDPDSISNVLEAIDAGYVSRTRFSVIIKNSSAAKMREIFNLLLPHTTTRSVFITDDTDFSDYFDEMIDKALVLLEGTDGEEKLSTCGCFDIDECTEGTHICPDHSHCINVPSGYQCHCDVGYTDHVTWSRVTVTNGEFLCVDINECVNNMTICGENMDCLNSDGSYECSCKPGTI